MIKGNNIMYNEYIRLRLTGIQLNDFMNVESGRIVIRDNSSIVGIYGPNGSGKSAIVKALMLLQDLFEKDFDDDNSASMIRSGKNKATLKFSFSVSDLSSPLGNLDYSFSLRQKNGKAYISQEYLDFQPLADEYSAFRIHINFRTYKEDLSNLAGFTKDLRLDDTDIVEQLVVFYKKNFNACKSFFSGLTVESILTNSSIEEEYESTSLFALSSINALEDYLKNYVIIFNDKVIAELRQGNLQDFFNHDYRIINSIFRSEPLMSSNDSKTSAFNKANDVISKLTPDLAFRVNNNEDDGKPALYVCRNGNDTPISHESYGICKLFLLAIEISTILFSSKGLLIIDELDEGIHEFLVGEIVTLTLKEGKGQLLFTAHNLRPLEILDKKDVFFSTRNPKKRYITMKNVKQTNNLRKMYARFLAIGKDDVDAFSYEINKDYIASCFQRAAYLLYDKEDYS